ncbi:MAG: hypothetical protein ACOYM2_16155 [Rectinemataceae bacterium]
MTYKIKPVAEEGDLVLARNPRSKTGNWEKGVVQGVRVSLYRNGRVFISYDVRLVRELPVTSRRPWARVLRVSVAEEHLSLVKKKMPATSDEESE